MATLPVPTRKTDEASLDQWNRALRASPLYQGFLKKHGLVDRGQGVKLSRDQQSALEKELATAGFKVPDGMHIDQGGNLNQKNRLLRNIGIGAGIAAATFGIPGLTPGLLSTLGGGTTLPSLAAGIPSTSAQAFGPFASQVASTVAGTAAGPVAGGLKSLAGRGTAALVGLDYGTSLLNSWLESRAYNKGIEADQAYRERALELDRERTADQYGLQRSEYEQTNANRAPYRSAGQGALTALAGRLGVDLPPVEMVTPPPSQMGVPNPTHTTRPGMPTPTVAAEPMVQMRSPRGQVKAVPASQVAHFEQRGAVRV
jgi:hypothetical protein